MELDIETTLAEVAASPVLRTWVLVAAMLALAWSWRRDRLARLENGRKRSEQHAALHAQLTALNAGIAELTTALTAATRSVERDEASEARRSPHAPVPAPATRSSYEIAIRLARGGASVEELLATCGMTRTEAELLHRLHGGSDRTRDARHNRHTAAA